MFINSSMNKMIQFVVVCLLRVLRNAFKLTCVQMLNMSETEWHQLTHYEINYYFMYIL